MISFYEAAEFLTLLDQNNVQRKTKKVSAAVHFNQNTFLYLCAMLQSVIIGILIILALAYLGRMVYRLFQGKTHCETGCAKCGDIQNKVGNSRTAVVGK